MRFLIDAQLPPKLCEWFEERGHDAIHVATVGMVAATDRVIADHAEREGLTLVSKDEDFLILRLPDRFPLLWLRVGNATNSALGRWLDVRWPVILAMLNAGERLVEVR